LLFYQDTKTNLVGFFWTGATFIAPTSGTYFFTISLVTDTNSGDENDDVFVHITRNGQSLGFAWKGEQALQRVPNGGLSRIGASYSVTTQLNQGDLIQTFVSSDSGRKRTLHKFDFTGFRICM
jgi:hypothetical protein